jgi:hypothetical protein
VIERPKKNKKALFGQEKAAHDKIAGGNWQENEARYLHQTDKRENARFWIVQAINLLFLILPSIIHFMLCIIWDSPNNILC